jgi:hypothetical protein
LIDRHQLLREVWLDDRSRFGGLTVNQEWDLHAYYVPSKELTDGELLQHRSAVTNERPSLPSKASKPYQALMAGTAHAVSYGPVITKAKLKGYRLVVRGVARPEPDFKKVAQALLELAREQQRREPTG